MSVEFPCPTSKKVSFKRWLSLNNTPFQAKIFPIIIKEKTMAFPFWAIVLSQSKQSQLEAEKSDAKVKLNVAENRVKQEKTTDKLARGTMNRLASTTIMGTILK